MTYDGGMSDPSSPVEDDEAEAKAAFARKMKEMRDEKRIPGYVGPRATRDR